MPPLSSLAKCGSIAALAPALWTSCAFAFLGATPDKCVDAYGAAKLEQWHEGALLRIYEPTFEGFGGARITASFYGQTVERIQYTIEGQKKFTRDQASLIKLLNGESKENPFEYRGLTDKGSDQLLRRRDGRAYLTINSDTATMNLVSIRWMEIIDAKTSGKAAPTPSPSERSQSKTALSKSKIPDEFSVEWLEAGCKAINAMKKGREHFTAEQNTLAMEVIPWLNGFIVGANAMGLNKRKTDAIFFPPHEWLDATYLAPKILAFISEHRDVIAADTPARLVMMAWYYESHPKAAEDQKEASLLLLEERIELNPLAPILKK